MNMFLIMLILCVVTQRIDSKSTFDHNINPEYDLVAKKSTGYSYTWPRFKVVVPPQIRYRHYAIIRGHEKANGKRKHPSPHDFDRSGEYNYSEYSDEIHNSPHFPPPHGVLPAQTIKHGYGHGHPHLIPPRFPPPPVYEKDFLNPWKLAQPTPKLFIVEQVTSTTPRTNIVREPSVNTPSVQVAPAATTRNTNPATTTGPPSTTMADDQLIYDIDVRFGRE